ncbi:sigma-70 family RNA polymerase sigma factor [Pseudoduganella eburnea]|uniref:Sigma-70 family RNA polymerase sigma factor n=1 Tax=Massilia eburnea TaxID=1776165 RepID=A0A6L6QCR6_9BURK|nr:RNA polymerase sigma factor [Massilia eburnea]MTW09513.1 sigma-70 family RNA polymerase sigma factor [Massilia eburnea]
MQDVRELLLACLPRLRRYARALTGDSASADDLVQDTVERGWSRIGQWRPDGDLRAWLFGIMHNLHIDQLRRAPPPAVELEDGGPPAAASPPALDLRDLERALQQLPSAQREMLLLVALEDMRYEDVAAMLDIPLGTVMSRLSRARENLRRLMTGQAPAATLKVVK